MSKETGFYTGATDASFRTLRELKTSRRLPPTISPNPDDSLNYSMAEWTAILERRQRERLGVMPIPKEVTVDFNTTEPVHVALIGDIHAGSGHVDYDRLHDEVLSIKDAPASHVVLLGDLVDGFFFQPAKEDAVANLQEEALYAHAMFRELQGRILAAWMGDHDGWAEKMGMSIYQEFRAKTGAHLLRGTSYITLKVGGQEYKIAGAHRFGGHSIYNNAHSAMRVYRDEAQGADICVTGHTHKKGYVRQPMRMFDGTKTVDFISVGPYKSTDKFGQKLGFGQQTYDDMGGFSLTLYPDRHQVDVEYDIRRGVDKFKRL